MEHCFAAPFPSWRRSGSPPASRRAGCVCLEVVVERHRCLGAALVVCSVGLLAVSLIYLRAFLVMGRVEG